MRIAVIIEDIGNLVYRKLIDNGYTIDDAVDISEIVEQILKENEDD